MPFASVTWRDAAPAQLAGAITIVAGPTVKSLLSHPENLIAIGRRAVRDNKCRPIEKYQPAGLDVKASTHAGAAQSTHEYGAAGCEVTDDARRLDVKRGAGAGKCTAAGAVA